MEWRRLPIISVSCCFVSFLSACRTTPTFFAILRISSTLVVELNNVSKSLRVNGDLASTKYDPSLLKINGGNGSLPPWTNEYTSHI